MRFYGLTTARVVAQEFFRGNSDAAYRMLHSLATEGQAFRYREQDGDYFSLSASPLDRRELEAAFARLWYCRMRAPRQKLISPSEFRDLFREAAAIADVPRRMKHVPCINTGDGLALLRVQPLKSADPEVLQNALEALQKYVASPAFEPWWQFARRELLRLVYLVRESEEARELARWLARHPLCSTHRNKTIEIPVDVQHVPPFPGPEKTRAPEGLLSSRSTSKKQSLSDPQSDPSCSQAGSGSR